MAKHLCANGTLPQNNFSAPVPVIGLYIAGGTMVCFLLIFCDVISGIRRRKQWLPCQFFSLNSVTLTLLSVASKLPVDLTTPMPSVQDQLSKLTGTALVCVSMCLFMPSIGASSTSESVNNMIALSILVITIIVNICIQMATDVIFSFIPEHIILMFFMLTSLSHLWLCTMNSNAEKDILFNRNKEIFTKGKGSMLRRLKVCYLHGYNSNPQFVPCKTLNYSCFLGFISLSVLVVILQVVIRTLVDHQLKFSSGLSDYGWSMWIILVTQILVILLGSLATSFRLLVILLGSLTTSFRFLVIFDHTERDAAIKYMNEETKIALTESIPFLRADLAYGLVQLLHNLYLLVMVVMELLLLVPMTIAIFIYGSVVVSLRYFGYCHSHKSGQSEEIEEYRNLLRENDMTLKKWIVEKCVEDMKRWKSINLRDSQSHLEQLLSKTPPSKQTLEELSSQFDSENGKGASCLYLVFLARIASIFAESCRSGNLVQCLCEVFDIVHFVDSKMNALMLNNRKKCRFAKFMWRKQSKYFSFVSPQAVKGPLIEPSQSQINIDRALRIIKKSKEVIAPTFIGDEVGFIVDFISNREYTSTQELYAYVEQLFVDMLHILLIQFPEAIFREVTESSVEEYEERVRLMLKFAQRVRPFEDKVQWSFPIGSNITSLTTDQTSTTLYQDSDGIGNVSHDFSSHLRDEIIQVE